ncbi:MAG: outer membrane protein assembly factor BamD [Pseudomonadota bacterium]
MIRQVCLPLAFLILAACSSGNVEEYVEQPVEALYTEGLQALKARNYDDSVKSFQEVERQHPYSVWATRAQLMAAYASYLQGAYDDAVLALNRFIDLNPGNDDIAYAYYLRAISYYEQISDVRRDQNTTAQALDSLRRVVANFPDTEYARDAKFKIDLAVDHLAGKEMSIGRYYLRRGEYLAAINRFQIIIEQYDQTTHTPEALARLSEAYQALGIPGEAERIAAVLGYNFPASPWYQHSYNLATGEQSLPQSKVPPPDRPWYRALWDLVS